jgi:hypothetical protein
MPTANYTGANQYIYKKRTFRDFRLKGRERTGLSWIG